MFFWLFIHTSIIIHAILNIRITSCHVIHHDLQTFLADEHNGGRSDRSIHQFGGGQ